MRKAGWLGALLLVSVPLCPLQAQGEHPGTSDSPRLHIGGFSDFNFFASDEKGLKSSSGFKEGQFVLHFVSALSDQFTFFGEVSLTATDTQFRTELERGLIKYSQSDYLKLSGGRFHTPINWWNTAYHHGLWLQTTVSRPEMAQFGGEFIPVHFVGALAEGAIPSGSLNLAYTVGVGNGRNDIISRAGDAGDNNNNRAWLVSLGAKPDAPYGLQFGGAFYRDKISFLTQQDFRESIASAYAVYSRETPEVIAEYARTVHTGVETRQDFASQAYYLQVGFRLPQANSRFKPYARYDKIDLAQNEPVFSTLTSREESLAGLRIDVAALVATKLEVRRTREENVDAVNAVFAQVAFAF